MTLLALSLPAATAYGQISSNALPLHWASGGPDGGQITGLVLWWAPSGLRLAASTNGGGIFMSDDAGYTWWRADGLTSFFVTSVSVSPLESWVLYAGVEAREDYLPLEAWSKLVKSTDGGDTWFESSEGIQNSAAGRSIVMDVAVSTTSPDIVYAGCISTPWPFHAPAFYRSGDAGITWQAAESGHNGSSLDVSVQPGNGLVVLSATDFGVYRTADGADSWTYVPFSSTQVGVVQFYPLDSNVALAGDATGIWRSIDGGLTWNPIIQPGAPTSRVTCFAFEEGSGFIYAGTESQGVFVSMDQGATWSQISLAAPLTSITELQIMPLARFDHFFAGTSYRGVYKSPDAATWEWSSEWLAASTVRACEVLQDGVVLAGLQELGAARSQNGLSWTPSAGFAPLETVLCFAEDPRDGGGVYAGTDSGNVYVSFDRGYSWEIFHTFENGGVTGFGVDRTTFGRFYAAVREDSVYVTEDGGATWSGSRFGNGGYLDLEVNPLDGSRVLVPAHLLEHGVYRTIDAGESWQLKAVLYPTNVAYDASDTSYAYCAGALDWGIWRSTDGGDSFAILTGFPGGGGSSYVAVDRDEGTVWGAKGAKGIYMSMNHGDTWLDTSNAALVNRWFHAVAVGPYVEPREVERMMVAVGLEGGGVWTNHDLPTGVPDEGAAEASAEPALAGHPNPWSGTIELTLGTSANGVTELRIYDITGRLVRALKADGMSRSVIWDGLGDDGREVASGVYVVEGISPAGTHGLGKVVRIR